MKMRTESTKSCRRCGHSNAAHLDGQRCALCGCHDDERQPQQSSFGFRYEVVTTRKNRSR
jgi:ribosomal protein L37E